MNTTCGSFGRPGLPVSCSSGVGFVANDCATVPILAYATRRPAVSGIYATVVRLFDTNARVK